MFDIDALERQLKISTHGAARRRQLLERAQHRFSRELTESAKAFMAAGTALALLLKQQEALAELQRKHGVERSADVPSPDEPTVASQETIVANDGIEKFKLINEFVSRSPYCFDGPFQVTMPIKMTVEGAVNLSHLQRAYLVPGYIALSALAQTQWMDQALLDEAVARAAAHGIIGETLADDLIGCIIDPDVIRNDDACARFADMRRRHRDALKAVS